MSALSSSTRIDAVNKGHLQFFNLTLLELTGCVVLAIFEANSIRAAVLLRSLGLSSRGHPLAVGESITSTRESGDSVLLAHADRAAVLRRLNSSELFAVTALMSPGLDVPVCGDSTEACTDVCRVVGTATAVGVLVEAVDMDTTATVPRRVQTDVDGGDGGSKAEKNCDDLHLGNYIENLAVG